MTRLVLVLLIVAEILMLQAVADKSEANPVGVKSETEHDPAGAVSGVAYQPASSVSESSDNEPRGAESPEIRRLGKHHSDKSVAGGGFIIGGLATAIFAAVFCYIRVTRKRNGSTVTEQHS